MLPAGPRALLVEVGGAAEALDLAAWVRAEPTLRVDEVVPAARTVLLDGVADPAAVRARVAAWPGPRSAAAPRLVAPEVEVPVRYDGPDLDLVAEAWGCSPEEVVARHTATPFTAAFCGFAPGFAYLAGLPPALAVPRRATPRPRVPAGSVALADAWCGVYPRASPGGWQLLGTTAVELWDVDRDPPALLAPGTRVRFHAT